MRQGLPGVERVRDRHPSDESWRADALAQSRHTRWSDELRLPLADPDPEKAAAICAAVTRRALRDFAPALMLLDVAERRRARALAAYALLLFDFADQAGLEGERLAQINRLEFELEAALAGEPAGQPVFVLMARAEAEQPWPRDALDDLAGAARLRVSHPRPDTPEQAAEEARRLGDSLARCLMPDRPERAAPLAAALLRLADLLGLAEATRRHRPRLPRTELPDDWLRGRRASDQLESAVLDDCRRVGEALARVDPEALARTQRRAARYLHRAAERLLDAAGSRGAGLLDGPPRLGLGARVWLLLRSFLA